MTEKERYSIHLILGLITIVLISTFETSLWYRLFSPVPNPQVWLSLIIYCFLYRTRFDSILMVYLPSFFIFILTIQPLGFLLLTQTCLYFLVVFIKSRVFMLSGLYFAAVSSISVFFFQFLLFLFSWVFEEGFISYPQVWKWITQAIITFLLGPALYKLFTLIMPPSQTAHEEGVQF